VLRVVSFSPSDEVAVRERWVRLPQGYPMSRYGDPRTSSNGTGAAIGWPSPATRFSSFGRSSRVSRSSPCSMRTDRNRNTGCLIPVYGRRMEPATHCRVAHSQSAPVRSSNRPRFSSAQPTLLPETRARYPSRLPMTYSSTCILVISTGFAAQLSIAAQASDMGTV
jgi:hypothetical protein